MGDGGAGADTDCYAADLNLTQYGYYYYGDADCFGTAGDCTDIDEYYWQDLAYTKEVLENIF